MTITDKSAIKKLFPGLPDGVLPQEVKPVGLCEFKGDKFNGRLISWSVNDKFIKGETYPVYDREGLFVVGNDGKSYKMVPIAWTKIIFND